MNDRLRELIQNGEWKFAVIFDRAVFGALRLTNGWIFCSVRYCVDPNEFDLATGKQYVKDDIVNQLIGYEAYKNKTGNDAQEKEAWYKLPVVDNSL